MNKPCILLSPPDFFEVTYAINPWMDTANPVDVPKAQQQWQGLKAAIQQAGADVKEAPPKQGLPDMVFTANAAFVNGQKALIACYKFPERQPEETLMKTWFEGEGYETVTLPRTATFEGSGDALKWVAPDGTLHVFSGYGPRSSQAAHTVLQDEFPEVTLHSIELIDERYYHVDVCMCPTDKGDFIYYPAALSPASQALVASVVPEEKRITVSEADAAQFGCNAVSINDHIIVHSGATGLKAQLEAKGYTVLTVDMSEFLKSGGSCKCLTLRLS